KAAHVRDDENRIGVAEGHGFPFNHPDHDTGSLLAQIDAQMRLQQKAIPWSAAQDDNAGFWARDQRHEMQLRPLVNHQHIRVAICLYLLRHIEFFLMKYLITTLPEDL